MLLDRLQPAPADAILALIDAFRSDPRDDKIDLGVGVYRDAEGRTPIMAAVHEAERRLLASQSTKTYVGMAGDADYNRAVATLVLGDSVPAERVGAVQAPGGCGALRLKEGSLYPALYRLEEAGLIQSAWEEDGAANRRGPRRRVYQLTTAGTRRLAEAREEWRRFVSVVGGILETPA